MSCTVHVNVGWIYDLLNLFLRKCSRCVFNQIVFKNYAFSNYNLFGANAEAFRLLLRTFEYEFEFGRTYAVTVAQLQAVQKIVQKYQKSLLLELVFFQLLSLNEKIIRIRIS